MTAGRRQDAGTVRFGGPMRGSIWALAAATLPDGTFVVAAGDSNGRVTWWDGASGELLCEAMSVDPVVVRSMTVAALPDGRIRFATAGSQGTVQLWDGAQRVSVGRVISSDRGPVWSTAGLAVSGSRTVLFTGSDNGKIHRWDMESGEPVGEPFGGHAGAVRAMTVDASIDGRPTLVTGADDGTVCRWDVETGQRIGPPLHSEGGAVWGLTVVEVHSGSPIVVAAGNNGVMSRWDDTGARLGAPIVVGPGSLTAVVGITLHDGRVALVCGSTDGRLSCWDARTGQPIGRPEQMSDRGVYSVATVPDVPDVDGRVRLAVGTDGQVTIVPVTWDSQPRMSAPAQVDSTRVQDGLGRRILGAHLGALLGALAADSDSTSAVVHVDGQWGAGKSTLVRLLLHDEHAHGRDWTPPVVVDYEAWRECAIAPEWWSLATAIEREVRGSRPWATRALMHVWSVVVRTIRSPATLTALAVAVVGGLTSTFFPSMLAQTAAIVAVAIGGLVGFGQVVGRTLFWHSAPFARLHLHTEENPLGQVAGMVGWLRGWTPRVPPGRAGGNRRRPILLVIDDLDRCPAERVVKILETVHTILRHPPARSQSHRHRELARLFVLVLADGRWVRQAFTSQFADFEDLGSTTRDLGSDFTQKVFDHVVLVPDLFAEQVSAYLDDVVGATTDGLRVSPDRSTIGTVNGNTGPQKDHALPDVTTPVDDLESMQIDRVRQEATAAATNVRSQHLLHTYAGLMPANPRMIKRVSNALGMLEAVRTHVQHSEDDDAMARAAILLIRFPVLAARLRLDDSVNGKDPCWHLPNVRDVLSGCSLESLARCLGRSDPPSAES